MNIIVVDETKCKRDGICAAECPVAGISMANPESFPVPSAALEETCIRCGHCVAVCPHGALSHRDMSADECPTIQKELVINKEQAEQFMRSRRSVRVYKDKSAPREVLQKIVDIARYAPTAHNDQEVEWVVIEDKNQVKNLAQMTVDWMKTIIKADPQYARNAFFNMIVAAWDFGFDAVCRSAPHLVIAHAEKGTPFSKYYPTDCASALAYFELVAPTFGMGTCWNGILMAAATQWQPLKDALVIPEKNQLNGILMLGYPKFKYYRLPKRRKAPIRWGL